MSKQVIKYTYLKNNKLLEFDDGSKVLVKAKKRYDLEEVYNYLDSHNVNNYLRPLKITAKELFFAYFPNKYLDSDYISKRLIFNLSLLQNKTTIYKEIDKDKQREEYDKFKEQIIYLEKYYYTLQDVIESRIYMSPLEYLVIRNISIIYSALNYSKELLEKWYDLVKHKKTERLVYCHGKCELDHFLNKDEGYFISLEKAHLGSPVEDFLYFYNKNYNDADMISNFKLYQHRYRYNDEEILYFLLRLVLPEKIDISTSSLIKTMEVSTFFDKLKAKRDFVLYYQKYDHKDKKNNFNEQENCM